MKTRKLTLLLAALVGLATSALAQTTQTQATVARVTGAATVTLPDGSTTPLTAGMKVAQGSTITTGADGDVYLESHAGYVTSIKHDSVVAVDEISVITEGGQVKEERTMLDLKSGNLVAKLDPKKKAVNNYQVRTPKGVAAARGTVFTVMFRGRSYAVAVVNGEVSIAPTEAYMSDGVLQSIVGGTDSASTVTAGQILTDGGTGNIQRTPFSFYEAAYTEVDTRELLAAAVATVALAAQNNIGGTTAKEAADVAKAVFAVAPGVAAQAAAIINKSGGDTSSSNPVIQAIRSEVPAAQQGSFDTSATSGTFTTTTTETSFFSGATTTTTTTTTPQPIDPSTISRSNE
ncbi:MAG: FecR domain-containing protein [Opitutaceae bacterium]|nr:FecR domain-containing protein [Opitutaceae bacterium]